MPSDPPSASSARSPRRVLRLVCSWARACMHASQQIIADAEPFSCSELYGIGCVAATACSWNADTSVCEACPTENGCGRTVLPCAEYQSAEQCYTEADLECIYGYESFALSHCMDLLLTHLTAVLSACAMTFITAPRASRARTASGLQLDCLAFTLVCVWCITASIS